MCDYNGYEFGAGYLDSTCIDGFLWDLDSCDEPGGGLTHGGEWPCPRCNTLEFLRSAADDAADGSIGESMFRPWCGATQWEASIAKASAEQPDITAKFLAELKPFVTSDWPDREAVYSGRASWENAIDRQWPWPVAAAGVTP